METTEKFVDAFSTLTRSRRKERRLPLC